MNYNFIYNSISIIESVLKYPTTNKNSYIQSIVNFALIPVIIPFFILLGYTVEIQENSLANKEMPKFKNYGELFKTGLELTLLYLPLLLITLLSLVFALAIPSLISFAILAIYTMPAIKIIYSKTRNYKDVYNKKFIDLISNKKYIEIYIYSILFNIILLSMSFILNITTIIIGFLLLLPILIYSRTAFWSYMFRNTPELNNILEE